MIGWANSKNKLKLAHEMRLVHETTNTSHPLRVRQRDTFAAEMSRQRRRGLSCCWKENASLFVIFLKASEMV